MVIFKKEYTRHYSIEGERLCSMLDSGFQPAPGQTQKKDQVGKYLSSLIFAKPFIKKSSNTPLPDSSSEIEQQGKVT